MKYLHFNIALVLYATFNGLNYYYNNKKDID